MSDPWLTIIGLGEDGPAGLTEASRAALEKAEVIFGGPRHLALVGAGDRGRPWPVPFSTAPVLAHRGQRVAVLASGDPFWVGAGGSLVPDLQPGEWTCHPAPSTFSLAAARMGWRLEEVLCFGLHAAPFERLRPVLSAGTRLICLLRDGQAAGALCAWLEDQGFGASSVTVLEGLG
ncbi:MAG: precorrin-6y C5,15-methyltransferase (decarboxylating) subunit CbiE, partial [Albidovulum sp.]